MCRRSHAPPTRSRTCWPPPSQAVTSWPGRNAVTNCDCSRPLALAALLSRRRLLAVSVVDDREVLGAERLFFLGIDDGGLEQLLGDDGRHEGGQDEDGHQLGG